METGFVLERQNMELVEIGLKFNSTKNIKFKLLKFCLLVQDLMNMKNIQVMNYEGSSKAPQLQQMERSVLFYQNLMKGSQNLAIGANFHVMVMVLLA